MAPQAGLEPTTLRLTAGCSTIELLRSNSAGKIQRDNYIKPNLPRQLRWAHRGRPRQAVWDGDEGLSGELARGTQGLLPSFCSSVLIGASSETTTVGGRQKRCQSPPHEELGTCAASKSQA